MTVAVGMGVAVDAGGRVAVGPSVGEESSPQAVTTTSNTSNGIAHRNVADDRGIPHSLCGGPPAVRMADPRRARRLRRVELEQLDGVVDEDLAALRLGHVG